MKYSDFLENRGPQIREDIEKYFTELVYNYLPVEPKMSDEEADKWMEDNVYNDDEAKKYLSPLFDFIQSKIETAKLIK